MLACSTSILSTADEERTTTTFPSQTKQQQLSGPAAQSHHLPVLERGLGARQPDRVCVSPTRPILSELSLPCLLALLAFAVPHGNNQNAWSAHRPL